MNHGLNFMGTHFPGVDVGAATSEESLLQTACDGLVECRVFYEPLIES